MKEEKPSGLGVRHLQVLLLFLGTLVLEFVKADISIAIVAMTDSSQDNTFNWSFKTRSVILSSYKWCYIISKIPGGELSARYGGKIVLLGCAILTFVPSILTPTAAYYGGWVAVCACRMVIGLAQGAVFPTMHCLFGKWVPVDERGRVMGIYSSATLLGTSIEYILAGSLASQFGWPAIFYFNSIAIAIWMILYFILGSSSPQDSKTINAEERMYIQKSLRQVNVKKRLKTPWKAVLTSFPFIALMFAQAGLGWGQWFILYEMPTYMNNILGVSIETNGYLSSLPYSVGFITCIIFGFASDYLIKKDVVTIPGCRKICSSIGAYGAAICLAIITYVTQDVTLAVSLFALAVGLKSGLLCGLKAAYLDMAPNHAGTIVGVSQFVSNLISIGTPIIAGFMVLDEYAASEWRKVFFLCVAVFLFTNTLFVVFGKCEVQAWNDEIAEPDSNKTKPAEKV